MLTLALIEAKLKEHRITPYTLGVKEGMREQFGVFDCEFVAVNHSIPTRWPCSRRALRWVDPAHR